MGVAVASPHGIDAEALVAAADAAMYRDKRCGGRTVAVAAATAA